MYGNPGYIQYCQPMCQAGMQPQYQEISRGPGINPQEYNSIIQAATQCFMSGQTPLSTNVVNTIKQMIGGNWFCMCTPTNVQSDFCMTRLKQGDSLVFCLNQIKFQILRI